MQVVVSGVEHALQTIQRYADIDARMRELLHRLREIGEPIIRSVHKGVMAEETGNTLKITASGEDVLFIEFGAGDQAGSENGSYDAVPASARPGSWSEGHAQMYSRYGFWVFGGHIFHEVPPSPAFYYAYEYMVQNLPHIAEEVFNS